MQHVLARQVQVAGLYGFRLLRYQVGRCFRLLRIELHVLDSLILFCPDLSVNPLANVYLFHNFSFFIQKVDKTEQLGRIEEGKQKV